MESLYVATLQRPWLWAVYVFTVGLPVILFISFMWPDKVTLILSACSGTVVQLQGKKPLMLIDLQRFGPPDQPYYYKKSDDLQPDDPHSSAWRDSTDHKGRASLMLDVGCVNVVGKWFQLLSLLCPSRRDGRSCSQEEGTPRQAEEVRPGTEGL